MPNDRHKPLHIANHGICTLSSIEKHQFIAKSLRFIKIKCFGQKTTLGTIKTDY
jgi:hypothetical protein